jgi:hypothetical protein
MVLRQNMGLVLITFTKEREKRKVKSTWDRASWKPKPAMQPSTLLLDYNVADAPE